MVTVSTYFDLFQFDLDTMVLWLKNGKSGDCIHLMGGTAPTPKKLKN